MKRYLYPQNLKAKANIWLWGIRDFIILCVGGLISIVLLVKLGWIPPIATMLCFGFLTIRKEEMTILGYVKYAIRYLLTDQQQYRWK